MNRRMLARIAAMSLMLGIATVACTPGAQMAHPAALTDQAPKAAEFAVRAAARAHAALAARKALTAVDAAEKAVAAMPQQADYRLLLGQSYLAAGRFASAETSFHDSLALQPDQPKARFNLALAEIAQGRLGEAQAVLHGLEGGVPVSDVGLALALAGDRQGAIAMLTDLVRSGKSDARSRQNLALAFALNGQWREARAVAMQDTPADRINDQIAHWAELARPQAAGTVQVAAMLGVTPSNDPGLPTELALAVPEADSPKTALALAGPAPVPSPVPAVAPTPVTQAVAASVTVPLDNPVPATASADAPASAVMLAAQQSVPSRPAVTPPPLLRAAPSPIRRVALSMAKPVPVQPARSGGWVVQLGAFSRAGAIRAAWSQASRLLPKLDGYAPVRAEMSASGASLVRLSVSGFSTRADAVKLCEHIHARGGQCFVRAAAGDAPLQWVKNDNGTRVASL